MIKLRGTAISIVWFVLSLGALFVYAGSYVAQNQFSVQWKPLLLPLLVYLMAHMLRAIRLGVLLRSGRARNLIGLYFYTTACSALIPFKLGELVRFNEIAWWVGGYWRGLLIVWIERMFDVIALGVMAYVLITSGAHDPKDIGSLLFVIGSFILVSILFFFFLPEQLSMLNLHVIKNYSGRRAISILRLLDSLYQMFEQVRPLIRGKIVTLVLLTLFIWIFELLALSLLFNSGSWLDVLADLLQLFISVLSDVSNSAGETLQFERAKVISLFVLGVVALMFYGNLRLRSLKEIQSHG